MWNKIQRIYIGTNLVRPKWHPWADTIAYYPLNSTTTVNDQSGNNRNLTKYWSCAFWTYQWVDCAYLPWNTSSYLTCDWDSNTYPNFTISIWYYHISNGTTYNLVYFWSPWIFINTSNQPRFAWANGIPTTPTITNAWKHIVCTVSWTTAKIYINGVAYTWTRQTQYSLGTNVKINYPTDSSHYSKWYLSEIIAESKVRSDTEVLNYYNQTKSNYWL